MGSEGNLWENCVVVYVQGDTGGIVLSEELVDEWRHKKISNAEIFSLVRDTYGQLAEIVKQRSGFSKVQIVFVYSHLVQHNPRAYPDVARMLEQLRHERAMGELPPQLASALEKNGLIPRLREGILSIRKNGVWDYSIFAELERVARKVNIPWSYREILYRLGILDEEIFANIRFKIANPLLRAAIAAVADTRARQHPLAHCPEKHYLGKTRWSVREKGRGRDFTYFYRDSYLTEDEVISLLQIYRASLMSVRVRPTSQNNRQFVPCNEVSPQKLLYTDGEITNSTFKNNQVVLYTARNEDGEIVGIFAFIPRYGLNQVTWVNQEYLAEVDGAIKVLFLDPNNKATIKNHNVIFPAFCGLAFWDMARIHNTNELTILADWSREVNGRRFQLFENMSACLLKIVLGRLPRIVEEATVNLGLTAGVTVERIDQDAYRAIKY